jgi:hypothetical protein
MAKVIQILAVPGPYECTRIIALRDDGSIWHTVPLGPKNFLVGYGWVPVEGPDLNADGEED